MLDARQVTPPLDEFLTIDEAAAVLRMSRTTFRRRLDRGEFTVVRDRRVVLVSRAALAEYVQRHTTYAEVQSVSQRAFRPLSSPLGGARPAAARRRRLWDGDDAG